MTKRYHQSDIIMAVILCLSHHCYEEPANATQ